VTTTNDWISFMTPVTVTGSGAVTYRVETNQTAFWRTGFVAVADRVVTLTQRPTSCSYLLSPSNAVHGAGDEIGFVSVTALSICAWTVDNTNSWISIVSGSSGMGNGTFSYETAANPLSTARTGVVVVADQTLTVVQAGAPCVYSITPSSRSHTSGSATGTVSVTVLDGCDWTVANTNSWVTLSLTNGSGNRVVTYTLDPNLSPLSRTGIVSIAGYDFTVSQSGAPCTYVLTPTSHTHGAGVETGSVGVAVIAGCPWNPTTSNSWIVILSGANGSGNGTLTYTTATNPAPSLRTGFITIGGQVFTVNQTGVGCSYSIAPTTRTHSATISTGTVDVTALTGCTWTVSNTNSWIAIASAANGSGNGTVTYTLTSNATAIARSGIVTIAGQAFSVTQNGVPCTFSISPSSRFYSPPSTNGTVAVTTLAGCAWGTINTNTWITLTSATNGTGTGTVAFAIATNASAIARSGVVTIAGQPFTVNQEGVACTYTISPTNRAYNGNATSGTVTVTAPVGCDWTVVNTNAWVTIQAGSNGSGSGSVDFSVAASQTAFNRTGVVVIATRSFTLIQTGAVCSYSLNLSNRTHGAGAENGTVDVSAFTGCAWTISNSNTWITITSGTNGTGSATVAYAVASNGTAVARSGSMTIAGRAFTVNQDGAGCSFIIAPLSRSFGFGATNGSVNVTSLVGCAWSAVNTNSWLAITSSLAGSGNGSISFTVSSNTTSFSRAGILTVAGQVFTVNQSGVPCTFTISPTNRSYAAGATNGTVIVTALDGCPWGTTNTNSWIVLTGNTNGNGTGAVDFAVSANLTAFARTGVVTIASQPFIVTQSGVTCAYSILPTARNHGPGIEPGSVDVTTSIGCAWTVSNSNAWLTITSGTNGSGSGTVTYATTTNGSGLSRSGAVIIAGRAYTVTQDGAPCTYSLSPTARSHGSGAETSTVSVATLTGCAWAVNFSSSWIVITSSGSGVSAGTVTYSVLANPSSTGRTGTVDVAGQIFTLTQSGTPCLATLAPVSWVHHATAEPGTVTVTMPAGCAWTSSNTNSWITLTGGTSGSGNGTVNYSVTANSGVSERSGNLTIAGQLFAVSQLGTACTFKISPTSRFHGSGSASNTVSVTASNTCAWSIVNTNPWVTILSNASGSASAVVGYSISSNRSAVPRSGVLNIAGEFLTLTQWGTNCALVPTPSSRAHGSGSETGLVTINVSSTNCAWTALTSNAWITINTGVSGTGNGSLGYTVAAYTIPGTRTGSITVNGEIFSVTQTGQACTYAIVPSSRAHSAASENGSVSVTAASGCAWTAANTNSWIALISGTSGSGDGTINYTVDANPAGLSRSGVFVVAGQTFTVTQAGASCTFTISPTTQNHAAGVSAASVTVTTIPGCSWTVDNTNAWIQITSAVDGTGSGTVAYSVDANPGSIARTGVVTVAGRALTVTQGGQSCSYVLVPTTRAHGGTAETGLVAVTSVAGCSWTSSNSNAWITLGVASGIGSGSVGYSLAANSILASRTGLVVIAGQTFTITQSGASCSYSLVPTSRSHGSGAETGSIGVAATAGCAWTVANTNGWILVTSGASGTGGGTVNYSVNANTTASPRSGILTIGGQTFTVTQAGSICAFVLSPTALDHGSGAETGTVAVAAGAGCAWTTANTNSWIHIDSAGSGTGNGTVTYSVTANPGLPRSGTLVIGGQLFAVSQTTGLRLVRVVNMNVALGQTNKLLVVLNSAGDENGVGFSLCYNTNVLTYIKAVRGSEATNAGATLNVNTGSTNRGRLGLAMALNADQVFPPGSNTIVEVLFRAAPGTNAVTTSISICDLPIIREIVDVLGGEVSASYSDGTVSVFGTCTYLLASASASFDETGGNGSVGVNTGAGCIWTVTNTNPWITITGGNGATGNGTVSFSVSPNGGITSRTGIVMIAGQTFSVTQSGTPCSYVIMPNEQVHGPGAETGVIGLTSLNGCAWTANAGALWINITSASTGSGSANINYSVDANPSSIGRTGTVVVSGQTFTVRQAGVPCTYTISPLTRAHSPAVENGSITVTAAAGCVWSAASASSWVTITSGSGVGNGTASYGVAFNPNLIGRTGVVTVAGQTFTVTQSGNPCAVTLSPTNANLISSGGTGLVIVAAAPGCAWTVGNTNPWITVTSSVNGTGNGSFGYSVASNPSGTPRTGRISVAGQFYTVDQAGASCVFAIAPTERSHAAASEGGVVSVATFSGCGWSVSNTNSWISISSPTTNVIGSGSVNYTVSANPSGLGRTGVVVIAGLNLTVSQAGATCSFAISPTSRNHGFGVESGSVTLNSVLGCSWSVINSNAWILITSETNGVGPWGVNYVVTNNPTGIPRSGVVTIAGQSFTVNQLAAPCTYNLSTLTRNHGSGATNNTVTVTTLVGCPWSVANSTSWIAIQSPVSNAGPGVVSYSIDENTTAFGRTGSVTIAGLSLTLVQSGAPCTYSISPTNRGHGYAATTNTVNVTSVTGCPWTINNTNNWVTFLSGTNGTGSVSMTYSITDNPTSFARTGVLTVAGQALTLVQTGAPCVYVLTPSSALHTAENQPGQVLVGATIGCGWNVSNTNTWITLTTPTNGTGTGTVAYLVATNSSALERVGSIRIAGQTFVVTQAGMVCNFTLSPTNGSLTAGNVTGLVNIATSPSCNWAIINTNPWIAIKSPATESGVGSSLIKYTAAANPNPSVRSGTLVIGGIPFNVSQLGTPCTYSLSPTNRLHGSGTETNVINVLTVNECSWTAASTNPWITILSGTNGSGNGSVSYFIDANPGSLDRTGSVMVAGLSFPITQLGAVCLYTLTSSNTGFGPVGTTGSVAVTATLGCTWTVSNTNNWITINSGGSGTNNGIVRFSVAGNFTPTVRSGNLRIGGQIISISQTGILCSFTVTPTAAAFGPAAETNQVSILTSNLCPWTVMTTNSWITILSGTNGSGSSNVIYAVSLNLSPVARSGQFTVAGQTISVTQSGIFCSFAVTPSGGAHSAAVETGQVSVVTSNICPWTVINTNTWITILSPTNVSGNSIVFYSVATNTSTLPRAGQFIVAGQAYSVSQAGFICSYAINPPARTHAFGAITGLVTVTTGNGCAWSVLSTNSWITFLGNVNRTNGGFASYVVALNPAIAPRTGVVTIAGQPFTVTQYGTAFLLPTNKTVPCGTTWAFDPPTLSGTCSDPNLNLTILSTTTNGTCGSGFNAVRRWDALDGCSNRLTITQMVSVVVMGPPLVTCAPVRTFECGSAWNFDQPAASESCGGANVTVVVLSTVTNNAGGCGGTFTATRTWQAIDGCGNSSTCSQTVHLIDVTPPVMTCGPARNVVCGSGWSFDTPSVTDNCGGTNVTLQVVSTVTNAAGLCSGSFIVTRTWESVDSCSNRATCSQTLTVIDSTGPSLTCAANKIVECGAAWNFDLPVAVDSCVGTNVTLRIVSTVTNLVGGCPNTFVAIRAYESLDSCSNRSTCAQIVTVVDTTPPVLACAADRNVDFGSAWTFDAPTASDSCSSTGMTLTVVSTVTNAVGSCGRMYTATRTWQATDACNNRSATCSQMIKVMDTIPPVLACSSNKVITCGNVWTFDAPLATDWTGGSNVSISVLSTVTNNAGYCGGTFAATRTWEAVDGCSNRSTCSQTVRLIDVSLPVLVCAANKTVPCGTAWNFDLPTATDGCQGTNLTVRIVTTVTNAGGPCAGMSVATRTWEAIDGCTNRSTCSQTVSVVDTTPPVLTCGNNKTVDCGTAWSFDAPTVSDSCVGTNVTLRIVSTLTNAAGACGNTFSATRTWEALDGCSNRITCAQTVIVADTTPPTLVCPATKIASFGSAWTFDAPTLTDSCSGAGLSLIVVGTVTNADGCGHAYSVTRTWQGMDACSNRSATCSQLVRVLDTVAPVLACVSNKVVTCGSAWTFDAPTATDLADGTNVTITVLGTVTNAAGMCGSTFIATRTWQATDGCSNSSMCSQSVRLVDIVPPVFTCGLNKTVPCGTAWTFDAPTAADSCSGTNVTIQILGTVTNAAGLCSGSFTATRTWDAVDACTNHATCSQTVTVIDTTAPTVTCPANKVVQCGTSWTFDAPTAFDSCAGTNVTLRIVGSVTNSPGACGNSYSVTRTWEATDGCSNRSTCIQIVTVVDTTPPAIVCGATRSVDLGSAWSFDVPVMTDTCGSAGLTLTVVSTVTNNSGACGAGYNVTRTWQAVDGCSNRSATCSQLVRVLDMSLPILVCPTNKHVTCGFPWTFDIPTASDTTDGTNVTIIVVSTVTNGTCASGFFVTRTWQAVDSCSNRSATCSQTVSAMNQAAIAGVISYHPTNSSSSSPTTKRLSPVTVLVTGGTNMSIQTAADGSYNVMLGASSTYTVTPRLTNSNPVVNGVSTLDISLIRRHILNIASLDTPYKLLAGDVNGSRSVTTLDISLIRRVILGVTNTFPMGLWRFVPSDYVFPDPLNPWDAPTNRVYQNLVAPVTNQDFMGIKLGDVNNSWVPPVSLSGFAPASLQRSAALTSAPEVTFAVSSHTNQPGDIIVAQITATGFRQVTSAQWTLAWDSSVLRYKATGKYGLKGMASANFGTTLTDNGKLMFSWDDPEALGVTAADGSTVFTANFEVIGAGGSVSPLVLSGAATEAEVGVNFSEANLRSVSGLVTVLGPGGELPIQPQLASVIYTNGVFGVPQQTVPGRRYILEYTDSLPTTKWIPLPPIIGDGSILTLSDPGAAATQRFYRLRIE
jgi:hypothetical protein